MTDDKKVSCLGMMKPKRLAWLSLFIGVSSQRDWPQIIYQQKFQRSVLLSKISALGEKECCSKNEMNPDSGKKTSI